MSEDKKPKYRLCWICNRKFRNNHFVTRKIDGYERFLHKSCAEDHDEGRERE